jgi:hypothetical protein
VIQGHHFHVAVQLQAGYLVVDPGAEQLVLGLGERALGVEQLLRQGGGTRRRVAARAFHLVVGHLDGPLLNLIVLGKDPQLPQFRPHVGGHTVLGGHQVAPLPLVGDQRRPVDIPLRQPDQGQLAVEEQLVPVAAAAEVQGLRLVDRRETIQMIPDVEHA